MCIRDRCVINTIHVSFFCSVFIGEYTNLYYCEAVSEAHSYKDELRGTKFRSTSVLVAGPTTSPEQQHLILNSLTNIRVQNVSNTFGIRSHIIIISSIRSDELRELRFVMVYAGTVFNIQYIVIELVVISN